MKFITSDVVSVEDGSTFKMSNGMYAHLCIELEEGDTLEDIPILYMECICKVSSSSRSVPCVVFRRRYAMGEAPQITLECPNCKMRHKQLWVGSSTNQQYTFRGIYSYSPNEASQAGGTPIGVDGLLP